VGVKSCSKCGAPLPLPSGRGRPRTRCQSCAPSQAKSQAPRRTKTTAEGVLAATRAELEAAGATGSSAGQAALSLAAAIDSGEDRGAALAALVKQLGVTMRAAVPDSAPEADPIQALRDELAARREHRPA